MGGIVCGVVGDVVVCSLCFVYLLFVVLPNFFLMFIRRRGVGWLISTGQLTLFQNMAQRDKVWAVGHQHIFCMSTFPIKVGGHMLQ